MIERLLRRHRLARLLGAAGLIVAGFALGALPAFVPQVIVLATAAFIVCLILAVHVLFGRRIGLAASVRGYGEPREVLRLIDAEIVAGREVRVFGEWHPWRFWAAPDLVIFTPSWLVQVNAAGVSAVRLDDILWVFKRSRVVMQTWGRERVSHSIRVYYRPDDWEVLPLSNPGAVDDVLEELLRRRREVLAGFFDEVREAATNGAIAAKVEGRRREWAEAPEAQRMQWREGQLYDSNEATQHLSRGERDAFAIRAWRTVTAEPKAVLCLRRVIAGERRRFVGNLIGLAAFVALWAWYIAFFSTLVRRTPGLLGPPLMMTCVMTFIMVGTANRLRRSFWWALRRQLAPLGTWRSVVERIDADMADDRVAWAAGTGRAAREPHAFSWLMRDLAPPQPSLLALSPNWLIEVRPKRAVVVHVPDLVWIWKRVVAKAVWVGGSQYNFELGCRLADGSERRIGAMSEEELDELAERLLEHRPALLTGWRGDWHTLREQGDGALAKEYERREWRQATLPDAELDAGLDESWDLYQRFVEHTE